jgi:hypothetical protein
MDPLPEAVGGVGDHRRMADDLTRLGARGFEQLCQALAVCALGPGIEVFGAGPDGGREASFDGRLRYPSLDEPWDGYGVLQAKFKETVGTNQDTSWFLGRVRAEMDAWTTPAKRRVVDGRRPEYLIFATNVSLSGVPGRGGKDRFDELMRTYAAALPLKGWSVWDANQITNLLNCYPEVRKAFAALITPNELIAALHDRLTAPLVVQVHTPPTQIRPGQPGQEAAFQPAYDAAGGAPVLGHATGDVYQLGNGWAQHFDGGAGGEPAVLCASFDHPAVAVAQSVWNQLCAVGGAHGGVSGIGYPVLDDYSRPYIGSDWETINLVGGSWRRSTGPTARGRLVRRRVGPPLRQPEIVFDSEANRDQRSWVDRSAKMDLRLAVAGRIPLVAEQLRITEGGRERMIAGVDRCGLTSFITRMAQRYGLDPASARWQEIDEPAGYNNSRFGSYELVVAGVADRPAIRAELRLTLPDGRTNEVQVVADLRLDFDAIRPSSPSDAEIRIPADLAVTLPELVEFLGFGWFVTTAVLLLAATADPVDVPPAGAPRLELYIQNERSENSGDPRVLRTLDLVDLSAFGRSRKKQLSDLSVAVTAPLGLDLPQIHDLVKRAMVRLAEDFSFTGAADIRF